MKTIIDASVGVKWFFKEVDWEKADRILQKSLNGTIQLVVPELFFYEVGNVLLNKKESHENITDIAQKLQAINFSVNSIGYHSFYAIANVAKEFSLTFYDALYITLMNEEHCEFITADKKLFQKVHKAFVGIKLL